jgi:hypothetical protein
MRHAIARVVSGMLPMSHVVPAMNHRGVVLGRMSHVRIHGRGLRHALALPTVLQRCALEACIRLRAALAGPGLIRRLMDMVNMMVRLFGAQVKNFPEDFRSSAQRSGSTVVLIVIVLVARMLPRLSSGRAGRRVFGRLFFKRAQAARRAEVIRPALVGGLPLGRALIDFHAANRINRRHGCFSLGETS